MHRSLRPAPPVADAPLPERNFAGAWMRIVKRLSLHFLYDDDLDADLHRFTVGAFYRDAHDFGLRYYFDAYYQTGTSGSGASKKRIHAFLFGGRLGWRFKVKSKLTLEAAVDVLSGDENLDDDTDRAFNTLFNAGHRHYGLMDYFLAQPRDNGGRGLFDGGLRMQVWPLPLLDVVAQFHHFRFTAPWIEADGRRTNAVGNELDVQVTLQLHRYFAIRVAFGAFTPDRGVTCVRGGCRDGAPTEYLGYLEMNLDIR